MDFIKNISCNLLLFSPLITSSTKGVEATSIYLTSQIYSGKVLPASFPSQGNSLKLILPFLSQKGSSLFFVPTSLASRWESLQVIPTSQSTGGNSLQNVPISLQSKWNSIHFVLAIKTLLGISGKIVPTSLHSGGISGKVIPTSPQSRGMSLQVIQTSLVQTFYKIYNQHTANFINSHIL